MGTERRDRTSEGVRAPVTLYLFTSSGWQELYRRWYPDRTAEASALEEFRGLFGASEGESDTALATFWEHLR